MTKASARKERRSHPRLRRVFLLTYVNKAGGIQRTPLLMARTLDISRSGVQIETRQPIPVESRLQMTIAVRDAVLAVRGRVMHVTAGPRGTHKIGVEFDTLLEEGDVGLASSAT
jgi:hypothetical protein